jgi:hypothetical protein
MSGFFVVLGSLEGLEGFEGFELGLCCVGEVKEVNELEVINMIQIVKVKSEALVALREEGIKFKNIPSPAVTWNRRSAG